MRLWADAADEPTVSSHIPVTIAASLDLIAVSFSSRSMVVHPCCEGVIVA